MPKKQYIYHFLFTFFVFFIPLYALAQADAGASYEFHPILENSGIVQKLASTKNFSELLAELMTILVALGAIWAVLELVYYGAKYALVDSFTGKEMAIKNIWPVTYGLLALLATYIIFKQINPNILNIGFDGVKIQNLDDSEPKTNQTTLDARNVCRYKNGAGECISEYEYRLLQNTDTQNQINNTVKQNTDVADKLKNIKVGKYCKDNFSQNRKTCVTFLNRASVCLLSQNITPQEKNIACKYYNAHKNDTDAQEFLNLLRD